MFKSAKTNCQDCDFIIMASFLNEYKGEFIGNKNKIIFNVKGDIFGEDVINNKDTTKINVQEG